MLPTALDEYPWSTKGVLPNGVEYTTHLIDTPNELFSLIDIYNRASNSAIDYSDRFLEDLYNRPKSVVIGIFIEQCIRGFILIDHCPFDGECIAINQISIDPDYQQIGCGSVLLALIENRLSIECDTLFLSTETPDYYLKQGWSIIQTQRRQWHLMSKSIAVRW